MHNEHKFITATVNRVRKRCSKETDVTRCESSEHSVFRVADQASVGKSLLEGDKLLNQTRSAFLKQEHQVRSLNGFINDLQQQACPSRI